MSMMPNFDQCEFLEGESQNVHRSTDTVESRTAKSKVRRICDTSSLSFAIISLFSIHIRKAYHHELHSEPKLQAGGEQPHCCSQDPWSASGVDPGGSLRLRPVCPRSWDDHPCGRTTICSCTLRSRARLAGHIYVTSYMLSRLTPNLGTLEGPRRAGPSRGSIASIGSNADSGARSCTRAQKHCLTAAFLHICLLIPALDQQRPWRGQGCSKELITNSRARLPAARRSGSHTLRLCIAAYPALSELPVAPVMAWSLATTRHHGCQVAADARQQPCV